MTDKMRSVDDDDSFDQDSLSGDDVDFDSDEPSLDELNDWGGGELEAAYMKALSALEASEVELPTESLQRSRDTEEISEIAPAEQANMSVAIPTALSSVDASSLPETNSVTPLPAARSVEFSLNSNLSSSISTGEDEAPAVDERPTPRQIIEACLFVGGEALTSKKLSGVLRGEFESEYIDREINELNRLYAAEGRPYEIRLLEGGYRFALREEFERIRHKVYGLGSKEVRLSQEALEVLAVVAYHQPIKQSRVEELGKPGCGSVLRQLVRRELIAVERDATQPNDVNYKTTPRFLSLFGIRNLDELPRQEQVGYK